MSSHFSGSHKICKFREKREHTDNYAFVEAATIPSGINDFGVITGYQADGLLRGNHSFVATPVPEGGTLGLVGTGLMMMAGVVRWRLRGFVAVEG
jgi:hypothetical protein